MRGAWVVFAKDAEYSAVKTRLQKQTNPDIAKQFYQLCLTVSYELACQIKVSFEQSSPHRALDLYWALKDEKAIGKSGWQMEPMKAIWTTSDELSQSLDFIYNSLIEKYDFVVLLGSDSPQLSSSDFTQVWGWLSEKKHQSDSACLIGPSLDGGFYAFIGIQPIPTSAWLNVNYSKPTTLSELMDNLKQEKIEVSSLPVQFDVDELTDLKKLIAYLKQQNNLLHSQQQLCDWLKASSI